ncbi:hypothetical protein EVAR_102838_1 [Eumeta japonica]|uniref:Uncharacterized protein n=1 Tax=Eumeta variegata TaxID=151549 RepID=A0A4C1UNM1_EUMVA|nr:hypothetical protein EVAR_102838_1 [Eumeta japonica]
MSGYTIVRVVSAQVYIYDVHRPSGIGVDSQAASAACYSTYVITGPVITDPNIMRFVFTFEKYSRLQAKGHTISGKEKWSKVIMNSYTSHKKRKRGRRFRRWMDDVKATAEDTWTRTPKGREE